MSDNYDEYVSSTHGVKVKVVGIEHETDAAYLFSTDSDDVWIPKSQVRGLVLERSELWIPKWLAEEKGLDYE